MEKREARNEINHRFLKKKAEGFLFEEESERICRKIVASQEFSSASVILAYMALEDEVNLSCVINAALNQGKKMFLPKVFKDGSMEFFLFTGEESDLSKGYFKILEPEGTELSFYSFLSSCAKEKILVLVPGRAFTDKGDRLGRGKGFYDRYIASLENKAGTLYKDCFLWGVCFNFQIMNEFPVNKNDKKMDRIFY